MAIKKINVLGVGISVLNLDTATRAVINALDSGKKGYVCVTGVHGVIEAQDDPALRQILNRAFLCTPDGMPIVHIGRSLCHEHSMRRVYGPDLMWQVFRITENTPVRHFLYGGNIGVAEKLQDRLLSHFPNANIVGTGCPPFRPLNPEEESALVSQMEITKPDITWIGLSTPKQEKFMAHYLDRLPTQLMFGVGAAFDFHAGLLPSAPAWMQQSSLEWLYRLTREPARLWPRYRRIVPRFLLLFSKQILGLNKFPLH